MTIDGHTGDDHDSAYDEALADYNRAIELDPRYAGAFANRGITRYATEDYAGAAADFGAAIELRPTQGRFFSHRALARFHLGRLADAQGDFEKALTLKADSIIFLDLAARAVLQGSATEALSYVRQAFELNWEGVANTLAEMPDFDAIRGTPAFQSPVKEFG